MKKDIPSWSAKTVTFFRALESSRPEYKRICYDPVALLFLDETRKRISINPFLRELTRLLISLSPHGPAYNTVVARTAYIDSLVSKYVQGGIRELVIFGAGFDSRAYRLVLPEDGITVFEIDHPATQEFKIMAIINAFGAIPPHVRFVGMDFERDSLEQKLRESGFDWECEGLFILEGVLPYLSDLAVDSIFGCISRNNKKPTGAVFTYSCKPSGSGSDLRSTPVERWVQRRFERKGEARINHFAENEIESFCAKWDLVLVENQFSDELVRRYFKGLDRPRSFDKKWGIAHASLNLSGKAPGHNLSFRTVEK